MAFLVVFAVVFLFSFFTLYSPEPCFGVGVSLPVSHAEIYRNWAITIYNDNKIILTCKNFTNMVGELQMQLGELRKQL